MSPESLIRPFEWLTSSESLKPILETIEKNDQQEETCQAPEKRALHVGCGSSSLGEFLVQELGYSKVLNIDVDQEILERMRTRWLSNHSGSDVDKMEFIQVDLTKEQVPHPSQSFDLVVDKSTFDCTLCSDEATTGLLCEAYRALKLEGAYYVLISFHHLDLLLPLLQGLPGAHWRVSHQVMKRQVEDLIGKKSNGVNKEKTVETGENDDEPLISDYRRTVNVLLCRRLPGGGSELDRDRVRQHIHKTNDVWFQSQNPMMDASRKKLLQEAFSGFENEVELKEAYRILFTDSEREHLTYDYFLQDWKAFLESRPELPTDRLSFPTAINFLKEMQ